MRGRECQGPTEGNEKGSSGTGGRSIKCRYTGRATGRKERAGGRMRMGKDSERGTRVVYYGRVN